MGLHTSVAVEDGKSFGYFINAIGALFKQRTEKKYYLTISPAVADNMDYTAINKNVDFVNLQLGDYPCVRTSVSD
jgi:hypothetical protein